MGRRCNRWMLRWTGWSYAYVVVCVISSRRVVRYIVINVVSFLVQEVRRLHRPGGLGDGVLDLLEVRRDSGGDDLFRLRVVELGLELPEDALGRRDRARVGLPADAADHLVRVADREADAAREVPLQDQERR